MSTAQQKTLEEFIQLQERNAIAHSIRATIELGVISELRKGQRTIEQLAEALRVYPDALKRLLDVVVETELLEKYGDDYALSAVARLIPERFCDFGDEHWKHLTLHVKTGAPLPICDEVPLADSDYLLNKSGEEWALTPTALMASQVLDLGKTRRAIKLLDIKCGSAVFGATFAHSDPDGVLSLLDTKEELQRARQTVESIGLVRKATFIENESLEGLDKIPELKDQTYDLVVAAGLIHRMTTGECRRFFGHVHSLVKPDHEFAIIDVFPGQEQGQLHRSIFELELGLRLSRGRLQDPRVIEEELRNAGFSKIQFAHLPAPPYYWGMILAQR